jgi:glutamyl-tRNA synthetase
MEQPTKKPIRVRMAPSPTGHLHIGTVRTALFNWLFARQNGGMFVMRIEDTDPERSQKEYETEIIEGLAWLGISWDEGPNEGGPYGPYRQSERTEIYASYLRKLLDRGDAYYCYCTKEELEAEKQVLIAQGLPPKYSGHCRNLKEPPAGKRPQVIRFKVPETKVEFHDLIRGTVTFDAGLFGDVVIAKSLNEPLYNFAVVVDDALMEITHVIRGEDHLSNTPKQILIRRAFGFSEPVYAHIPLILNPDRSKMSKRFSDTAVMDYRDRGYLPAALLNFLSFLGWHPKGEEDILTADELIAQFDLSRVQRTGAIFDQKKLDWLNREYLRKMSDGELAAAAAPFFVAAQLSEDSDKVRRVIAVVRDRATTLHDLAEDAKMFFSVPPYDPQLLVWKRAEPASVVPALRRAREAVAALSDGRFLRPEISSAIANITDPEHRGEILWPLRVALSGAASSPDPVDIMFAIGREESLRRIDAAIATGAALR